MIRCARCVFGKTWDYNSYCWNCGSPQRCTFELIVSRIFKSGINELFLRFSVLDGFIKNNISYWDNFLLLEKNRPDNLPKDLIGSLDHGMFVYDQYEKAKKIILYYENHKMIHADHLILIKELGSFFDNQEIVKKFKNYETNNAMVDNLNRNQQYTELLQYFNQNQDLKVVRRKVFVEVERIIQVYRILLKVKDDDLFLFRFKENSVLIESGKVSHFFKQIRLKKQVIDYLKEKQKDFFKCQPDYLDVLRKVSVCFSKYSGYLDRNGKLYEFSSRVFRYAFKFSSCIESLVTAQKNVNDLNKLILDVDFIFKLLPFWPFTDATMRKLTQYLDSLEDFSFLIHDVRWEHGTVKIIWNAGCPLVTAYVFTIDNVKCFLNRSNCEVNSENQIIASIEFLGVNIKSSSIVKLFPMVVIYKPDGSLWIKATRTKPITKELYFG